MTITLGEIKLQARQRADQESGALVSESELTSYVNNSIAELHDIMCEAYGSDYFVLSVTATVVPGTAAYSLPSDFYEITGLDMRTGGNDWVNVKRFNFNERNRFSDFGVWDAFSLTNIRYRLVGNQLRLSPVPDTNAEYQLWYVPVATKLVNDSDTLDDFNAYSEYVIVDAAIKMMQKEESDVSVFMAQKQALEKRIRDKSQNRDAANANTITDAWKDADDFYWRTGF